MMVSMILLIASLVIYAREGRNGMANYQKSKEEVRPFLDNVNALILKGNRTQINCRPWKGNRVNKTLTYMAETGINQQDIEKVILELQVTNYSYTADDVNIHFPDEQFWIFGITRNMIDKDENLYIKLKIRQFENEFLLIMSFHPEMPKDTEQKLIFPYNE